MRGKKKKNKTELMRAISVFLSEQEATILARSLPQWDRYYVVRISENPKAQHISRRERFDGVRYPHNGENADDGHAMFADSGQLVGI